MAARAFELGGHMSEQPAEFMLLYAVWVSMPGLDSQDAARRAEGALFDKWLEEELDGSVPVAEGSSSIEQEAFKGRVKRTELLMTRKERVQ